MVMRKSAMGVNLRQSILKSFGRYIAIVLIIALGSGIFVGLLMTKSDMVLTGQDFMEKQALFDLRFVSTYGWTDKQVAGAGELPGVNRAAGVLYFDLIATLSGEEQDSVYRFYTLSDAMNRFALRGGRMPERENECLADGYVFDDSILGKTVTVSNLNDEDTLEDVAQRSFTVVGYGASPLYMDMNRGTTSVGSGVLDAFFYVMEDAFTADYYTELHVTLPESYPVYSEEYNRYLEEQTALLEPHAEALGQQRFQELKQEAEAEYADGYQEYLDGLQEYEEGKLEFQQELQDAWQELKDGEAELIRATAQLKDSERMLQQTEYELEQGQVQLDSGFALLEQKKAEALAGIASLQDSVEPSQTLLNTLASLRQQIAALQESNENPELLAQLQAQEAALSANEADANYVVSTYNALITARDVTIPANQRDLEAKQQAIWDGWPQVEQGWRDIALAWEELDEAKLDLEQGFLDYEEGKLEGEQELRDAEEELKEAEAELKDAREEIDSLEPVDVFVLDRTSNTGYNSLDSTSDIVAGVSRVIPVFFLLVASLVCITTMTRMIDEERTQIGTLKALGYSNGAIISKYLIYAGSGAVLGCGLGVFAGSIAFPKILWEAYKIMLYIQDDVIISINWWLCGIVVAVYTAVILFVTWYCCRKALQEQPAELIRPKAPDPGKQLLVEKLPLWRHISFLNKVMVRNIFRYRQRLAMMLVGIGGCTALLVTGFGLRDSIMGVVDYQFENVTVYDMEVYFTGHQERENQQAFLKEIDPSVENAMFYHQSSMELDFDGVTKEIYLISGEDKLKDFLILKSGETPVDLPGENEVVLSVGVCEAMGIQLGDTITLRNADLQILTPTVSGIYDNHVYNYCIVSPETLENAWGEPPEEQMAYIRLAENVDSHTLGAEISEMDDVMNVTISQDVASLVGKMMEALDLVVVVIVFCAGLLAAIVLYNLTNININERIREIATIKVLGFNARETAAYVFKENLTLTIVGSILGLGLGKLLLLFVMSQVKIDMVWFKTIIEPMSYGLSFVLTIAAAFVVNFVFYFKLDKINMAEALKSVE